MTRIFVGSITNNQHQNTTTMNTTNETKAVMASQLNTAAYYVEQASKNLWSANATGDLDNTRCDMVKKLDAMMYELREMEASLNTAK